MIRLGLVAAVAALAFTGTVAAGGFEQGVAAGEMRDTEATVWTRAPQPGRVTLQVTSTASFDDARGSGWQARAENDRAVTVVLRGLRPAMRYRYRFVQAGTTSPVGTFRTAPAPATPARVRFAFTGDADATPGPNGKPAFNSFETYARMARERNDFNVNLGDTIYSDSEVGGAKVARTVPEKWSKYRLGLALPALRTLRAATGLYSHWDDHEFINDFSRAEHGSAIYRAGVKAFTDYAPVAYTQRTGLYRTFRWGKNLELFFLDERSFRSAKATTVCANDLAPQAPQTVRAGFAQLAPGLAQPVSRACTDTLDDPARTMLGPQQHAAFVRAIRASTATWKVVMNEVPLLQLYALPYDRWEGYNAERTTALGRPCRRAERRLPHHRHAREPDRRDSHLDARSDQPGQHGDLGSRHGSGRDQHVREGDRRLSRGAGHGRLHRRAVLQAAAAARARPELRCARHVQLRRGRRDQLDAHRAPNGRCRAAWCAMRPGPSAHRSSCGRARADAFRGASYPRPGWRSASSASARARS